MTNIYGVPDEVVNNAPQEDNSELECPYCHAKFVEHLRYEGNDIGVYHCHTCETIFKIKDEIPF